MAPPEHITRREAVGRLTALVGGALSTSTVAALVSGCRAMPAQSDWTPTVLTSAQVDVLRVIVDRIIPPTDTPGANDVGVAEFIDRLLAKWAEDDEKARVLAGLDGLPSDFLSSDEEVQVALLSRLDVEAVAARDADADPLPFFATIKEWTLSGYYTSEAGATQELQWLAVPERYDADVPLAEVGRTWA